jgi:hypothetical protein
MTALDELRNGEIADDFVNLLQRTIRAVAVARNFPPPEGYSRWESDAVASAVADFLADAQTPRRLTDLALHCRTDEALRHRLQESVRNYFADIGRRTPVGRLVLRINEVLATENEFERQGRRWSLRGLSTDAPTVNIDALVAVISGIDVVVPTAWVGVRRGPDIDAPSIVRLAHAAISAAGGPLRAADIAQAVAIRIGLGGAPLSIEATGFDPPARTSGLPQVTGELTISMMRAEEIFLESLNDAERVSIGLPELPVADLGPLLGVSGSKAATIRNRAISILRDELKDEENGQEVANIILDLARTWTETWMR